MTPMVEPIVLRNIDDFTLANAERVAFDNAPIELAEEAKRLMARGRLRFEEYLRTVSGPIYGTTTAAGARARKELSPEDSQRRAQSIRSYGAVQAGLDGERSRAAACAS